MMTDKIQYIQSYSLLTLLCQMYAEASCKSDALLQTDVASSKPASAAAAAPTTGTRTAVEE